MEPGADVLVLGGGMAGLSAAAWSVRQGRSVVLVEKGELGGTAVHAGFVWTAPTLEALRDAVPDGDPDLGSRLIDDFPAAVEWVRSLEVDVQPAVTVLRFGRGHQTALPNYLHQCARIVRDDPASEILLGAEATRLLLEDGVVQGAEVAFGSGETRTIHADAVVLATGGFANDPELRASMVHPNARDLPVRGNRFSNGNGLRLARAAGAYVGPEDAGFYGHLFPSGITLGEHEDFLAISLFHSEHSILLDLRAQRFVDETIGDHLTTIALVRQPEARGLLIADQRVRDEHISTEYVEGVRPLDPIDTAFTRNARCAVAEDLDELALLPPEWGYDGAAVRDAVRDFNRQTVEGSLDPPRRFDPRPLDRPPYYVIESVPAITFPFGGVGIDRDARVVDRGGRVIPGLYAAGADAGGVYCRAYAGGIAAALVFGLRAARTALERAGVPA
jgi:succinate dehydrogenase/fumarate reductase flavoprotein subunit